MVPSCSILVLDLVFRTVFMFQELPTSSRCPATILSPCNSCSLALQVHGIWNQHLSTLGCSVTSGSDLLTKPGFDFFESICWHVVGYCQFIRDLHVLIHGRKLPKVVVGCESFRSSPFWYQPRLKLLCGVVGQPHPLGFRKYHMGEYYVEHHDMNEEKVWRAGV